ncbi:hypothetical protein CSKR_202653, partial [Clonorchis sinensis]
MSLSDVHMRDGRPEERAPNRLGGMMYWLEAQSSFYGGLPMDQTKAGSSTEGLSSKRRIQLQLLLEQTSTDGNSSGYT